MLIHCCLRSSTKLLLLFLCCDSYLFWMCRSVKCSSALAHRVNDRMILSLCPARYMSYNVTSCACRVVPLCWSDDANKINMITHYLSDCGFKNGLKLLTIQIVWQETVVTHSSSSLFSKLVHFGQPPTTLKNTKALTRARFVCSLLLLKHGGSTERPPWRGTSSLRRYKKLFRR